MAEITHIFESCTERTCVACSQPRSARHMHLLATPSKLDALTTSDWAYFVDFIRTQKQSRDAAPLLDLLRYLDCGLLLSNSLFVCSSCCFENARVLCSRLDWPFFDVQTSVNKGIFA